MPTIALVDDDRNILTSVSIALEGEGYRLFFFWPRRLRAPTSKASKLY